MRPIKTITIQNVITVGFASLIFNNNDGIIFLICEKTVIFLRILLAKCTSFFNFNKLDQSDDVKLAFTWFLSHVHTYSLYCSYINRCTLLVFAYALQQHLTTPLSLANEEERNFCIMSGRGKAAKSGKSTSKSRSVRAGLQFPVGRIHRFLRKGLLWISVIKGLVTSQWSLVVEVWIIVITNSFYYKRTVLYSHTLECLPS